MNSLDGSLGVSLATPEDEQLGMILSRYVDDMERGAAPSPDQLIAAHPEFGDRLKKSLRGLNWFQRAVHEMKGEDARVGLPNFGAQNSLSEYHLGDYRLVREIGRGGMGVVYEARQLSLGRTVALKLLPFSGLLDQKQIARFRNEAQAAAALHHPHIVPVFAVGCERGVHYYSMQFIDGQSLASVVGQLRGDASPAEGCGAPQQWYVASPNDATWDVPSTLDLARAPSPTTVQEISTPLTGPTVTTRSAQSRHYVTNVVQLIVQAADALQHAHECGIVHRDIKPSNLLLDRHGKLWITDFGLARCAVGPDLTVTGDIFGTIRYMSPEQAVGQHHLVDHRADIYSLGITLYELLTLQVAFDGDDRQDVLRRVQEIQPPSLRSLNPAIPYDLETIVFKAVAKSRDDRYASASELADDLRRFLAGEPTHARRPTMLDRTIKWLARHKGTATVFAATTAIYLLGISVAAALLASKQHETDWALQRSRTHMHQLQQVVDRLGAGVSEKLRGIDEAEPIRAELLADTLSCYQTLLTYASEDPTLAVDAAKAAFKAGTVHEQLGAHEQALQLYRDSRRQFVELLERDPGSLPLRADLALVDNNLGTLLTHLGDYREGVAALQDAADLQTELLRQEPNLPRFRNEWALGQINLGLALADLGRQQAAARCYRQAISALRTSLRNSNSDVFRQQQLATALHNLSGLLSADDPCQAEELSLEATQILRQLAGTSARAELGLVLSHMANLVGLQCRPIDAQRLFAEAISIQADLLQRAPQRTSYRIDLATTRNNLGQHLLERGDLVEAEAQFKMARRLFEQLVAESAGVPMHYAGLAAVLDNLGQLWQQDGKLEDAVHAFATAVKMQTTACERAPGVERYRRLLESHQADLARVREMIGQQHEQEGSRRRGSEPTPIAKT